MPRAHSKCALGARIDEPVGVGSAFEQTPQSFLHPHRTHIAPADSIRADLQIIVPDEVGTSIALGPELSPAVVDLDDLAVMVEDRDVRIETVDRGSNILPSEHHNPPPPRGRRQRSFRQ